MALLLGLDKDEAHVDGLRGEQLVALGWVWQRQLAERRLSRVVRELEVVDDRADKRLTERAAECGEWQLNGRRELRLGRQLVAEAAPCAVDRVAVDVVVDACLDDPLVRVGGEARRFVEELWDEVVRAERAQLKVYGETKTSSEVYKKSMS